MTNQASESHEILSNTRHVSLGNLAALCYILREKKERLNVKSLANEAISHEVFDFEHVLTGQRLPTRIHHHMIALRKLDLVDKVEEGPKVFYSLTDRGIFLLSAFNSYSGMGPVHIDFELKKVWRKLFIESRYVCYHWLKHFLATEHCTERDLLSSATKVVFSRVPKEQRVEAQDDERKDSGYRLTSRHVEGQILYTVDHKEIYQGLRKWTNEVYLTDDRLPDELSGPYLHQLISRDIFELESHIVKYWLNPKQDVEVFEKTLNALMDSLGTNRIPIPDLIIQLCENHDLCKENIRELLVALHYEGHGKYFFRKG